MCPGFFTRPTGDLGLQLSPRTDHVETNRPRGLIDFSYRPDRHGAKTPCRANTALGDVPATPSGPPSVTSTWRSSQIARVPSRAAPGMTASSVVSTAQVEPTVGSLVARQGTVAGTVKSVTVACSSWPGPLALSVSRTGVKSA